MCVMPHKIAFMLSQSLFSNTRYTRGIHYIIIGSFLYSNFPLLDHIHFQFLDRIHVFGKLLGENVPDLDSEERLMYNITVSLHGRTLVSTMHTYIIHMVNGGSLLKYIIYTVEDAVEQLLFTKHLSVT